MYEVTNNQPTYQLPQKIEQYIASLSTLYERTDRKELQSILVNAQLSIEDIEYSLDGGQTGFLLHLNVPGDIFAHIITNKDGYEQQINQDVSKLINIPGEYVTSVSIEMSMDDNHDWREKSGLMLVSRKDVPTKKQDKIWTPGHFRVFLSHKAEFKSETAQLKEAFGEMGISAFVAHNDIEPTAEWQTTIEEALFTMDVFIALMTENFHGSNWTDQEVGIAIGREVPIISVRLGRDPYGFIGKYQGMQGMGKNMRLIANELFGILLNRPEIKEKLKNAVIGRFCNADSWGQASWLMELIGRFHKLSPEQIHMLEEAPEKNDQVSGAWKVQRMLPGVLLKFRGAIQ